VEWEATAEQARADLERSPELAPVQEGRWVEAVGAEPAPAAPTRADLYTFVVMRKAAALEQTLSRLIAKKTGATPAPTDLRQSAAVAREAGAISEETRRAIEGLAILRNLAAHAGQPLSEEKAAEFVAIAEGVQYALDAALGDFGESREN
jgi:hypothetical protein